MDNSSNLLEDKKYHHVPVMLEEVIEFLNIKSGGLYFDGTLGGGSYTREISKKAGDGGVVLATDLDPLAINNFLKNAPRNTIIVNDNFANLGDIIQQNKTALRKLLNLKDIKFDGMVLDLGLSSAQLDDDSRGFSFMGDCELDMSFGPKSERDTHFIVNNYKAQTLERIIKDYGEESWAKKIAQNIVDSRRKNRISSTKELADIVASSIPRKFWSKKIHPATKTFQALRIETNQELENLRIFLTDSIDFLKPGGRLVVVSFHSLEDRMVKNFFRNLGREDEPRIKILTKKPASPETEEIEKNFRSRSAKLRAIEKL